MTAISWRLVTSPTKQWPNFPIPLPITEITKFEETNNKKEQVCFFSFLFFFLGGLARSQVLEWFHFTACVLYLICTCVSEWEVKKYEREREKELTFEFVRLFVCFLLFFEMLFKFLFYYLLESWPLSLIEKRVGGFGGKLILNDLHTAKVKT